MRSVSHLSMTNANNNVHYTNACFCNYQVTSEQACLEGADFYAQVIIGTINVFSAVTQRS
jgi:mannose/cellobiose epimerase-like protein (N-acyl-D-glucosamine 2-epimerase family)